MTDVTPRLAFSDDDAAGATITAPDGTPHDPNSPDRWMSLPDLMNHPGLKEVIANPQINRSDDVPYGAGASNTTPITNIDKDVPYRAVVGDKMIDPSFFVNVHEQVEKTAMDMLLKRGYSNEEAYAIAHWDYANPAERQAVEAAGVDWDKYQAFWDSILPGIQKKSNPVPPVDLYVKPYPHDDVRAAKYERTDVPQPNELIPGSPIHPGFTEVQAPHGSPSRAPTQEEKDLARAKIASDLNHLTNEAQAADAEDINRAARERQDAINLEWDKNRARQDINFQFKNPQFNRTDEDLNPLGDKK